MDESKNSKFINLLTYITAVLTLIPITLQAINQYIILPYQIKSILNNLIVIALVLLSITIVLLIISIFPFYIYKKRKISFLTDNTEKNSFSNDIEKKEDSTFAKNPIEYFMKSLKDDEITENIK